MFILLFESAFVEEIIQSTYSILDAADYCGYKKKAFYWLQRNFIQIPSMRISDKGTIKLNVITP